MKAYKGFNRDMTCRGFQYKEGETYEEPTASLCHSGFHACEYPLDCFIYYKPADAEFHEVELMGVSDERDPRDHKDSKVVAKKITVGAKLDIADMVKAAIDFTFSRADQAHGTRATKLQGAASATGDHGAASATGDRGAASATGDQGAASATGDQGAASATGVHGAASATGYRGAASATGYRGAASATGDQGAASATGVHGAASATGYRGAASATGDRGAASATGYRGAASATGDHGAASATGDRGAASATGDQGAASATGQECISMSVGFQGKAKGAIGCWLVLAEWKRDEHFIWHRADVQCFHVDGEQIKADTWYMLVDGKAVEAAP